MIGSLSEHRKGIATALEDIRRESAEFLQPVNEWSEDLLNRLTAFATSGKLIRGSLAVSSGTLFGASPDPALYRIAAAIELVQSFLLIHDDIMDQDPVRRGAKAIYEQYRTLGAECGYREPARFGESMGICGGDVAALLATNVLASLDTDPGTSQRLTRLMAAEISKVGVAQMADVANGHRRKPATEQEITDVYRFKTGRYTFSLPLMLGAIYAGQPQHVVDGLSRWGEIEGVIFQIRDDHLGIMGDTGEIGKPAGTDITSDKQTLHRLEFMGRTAGTEWEPLQRHFGSDSLSDDDLGSIRAAMKACGALDALDDRIRELRIAASGELDALDLDARQGAAMDEIDAYNAGRVV